MKRKDVVIGMKVVPHSKSVKWYCNLNDSTIWGIGKDQGYLFVIGFNDYCKTDDRIVRLNSTGDINGGGDFFYAEDFEPYIEKKFKIGDKVIYNSATLINLAGNKIKKGDEGTIISDSKRPNIYNVKFELIDDEDTTFWTLFIEEKHLDLKGEDRMENLKELERKHFEMGKLIEKIREEEKSKEDYVLKLKVSENGSNYLTVGFYYSSWYYELGHINPEGECSILNDRPSIKSYEVWREKGMKVCSDKVEWRGKEYFIGSGFELKNYIIGHCIIIYNFSSCEYYKGCNDDNIVRFKHNNRPIGF